MQHGLDANYGQSHCRRAMAWQPDTDGERRQRTADVVLKVRRLEIRSPGVPLICHGLLAAKG